MKNGGCLLKSFNYKRSLSGYTGSDNEGSNSKLHRISCFESMFNIFLTFFKIGAFTFGGGFAMIPMIEKEICEKKKWINKEDIVDIFAMSQAIPGAIAINSATFIGYKVAGKKGAVAATCGVVLPSLVIISIIAALFIRFDKNPVVEAAFMGIQPVVVALIIMAAVKVGKVCIHDLLSIILTGLTVALILIFQVNAIFTILLGGVAGTAVYHLFPKKACRIIEKEQDAR